MVNNRFDQMIMDEPMCKYLYVHHITPENFREHEESLKAFFKSETDWTRFVREYMTQQPLLSYRDFLKKDQHMDLFMHPRYIQQEDHIHDFFEMKYQLTGSGTVYVHRQVLFLNETDLCLISPYVPHRNEVYSDNVCMLNIVLPPEYLNILFPRIMRSANEFRDYFEKAEKNWLLFKTKRNMDINRMMSAADQYYASSKNRSAFGDLLQENTMENVLLQILEMKSDPHYTGKKRIGYEQTIARIMEYLALHLEDASIVDVAEMLHFSPGYVSRIVKRETGYTFQMLLLITRMEAAVKLLRETNMTVDQIAVSVGLTGKSNFYEKFRAFYGVNPGEYRKKTRE